MDNSQSTFILHRNLSFYQISYKENGIFFPCAESKCQKKIFQKNSSNFMTFSINHVSKRGLNLIIHILGMKYGEISEKI